jgi:hypothetical protein
VIVNGYTVQVQALAPPAFQQAFRGLWFDVFRLDHRAQAEDEARDLARVLGRSRVRLVAMVERGIISHGQMHLVFLTAEGRRVYLSRKMRASSSGT